MKNITKALAIGVTLSSITLSASCASWQKLSPPVLELRTLELHPTRPGVFYYPVEVCHKKNWFGGCSERGIVNEEYDTNNKETMARLIATGFVLKVREKP